MRSMSKIKSMTVLTSYGPKHMIGADSTIKINQLDFNKNPTVFKTPRLGGDSKSKGSKARLQEDQIIRQLDRRALNTRQDGRRNAKSSLAFAETQGEGAIRFRHLNSEFNQVFKNG